MTKSPFFPSPVLRLKSAYSSSEISIGRVIATERGKGYGKQIMLHAINAAVELLDAKCIEIQAQEYAKGFYESVGFRQTSDIYILENIPHINMTWSRK